MHRLRMVIRTANFFICAMILSSCAQHLTEGTQTAQSLTPLIPPSNPISTDSSINLSTPDIISHMPNEQIYVDPMGQYAIKFSDEWKPTDKPNSYSGNDGFFETGYLPEFGYASRGINVCVWLANMDVDPEQQAVWLGESTIQCRLISTGFEYGRFEIYENPGADFEHRFAYLKTRGGKVPASFWWLKPMQEKEPEFELIPLHPEDASFWTSNASIPPEISVKEYALPAEAQTEGPTNAMLLKYVPPDMLPTKQESSANSSHEKPSINEQLQPYGYELKASEVGNGKPQELYRDGKILFDNVYHVSDVYNYSTDLGSLTVFTVETRNNPGYYDVVRYSIQNDIIRELGYNLNDPPFPPILYKGELLWVRAAENAHVRVQTSNQQIVFSFATYFGTRLPVNAFKAWNDHWILEVSDFLIQDGEILNKKFGFEDIFNWSLVNNKPLYFFRKGPRIGFSYDGKFIPLNYRDVAHGFCCGLGVNNPRVIGNTVTFFGNRDGVWYYVTIEVD